MSVRTPPLQARPLQGRPQFEPLKTEGRPHGIEREAERVISQVSDQDLDVFLKARAQKQSGPQAGRGVAGLMANLISPPKTPAALHPQVKELQQKLSGTLTTLGQIYADGFVTEHEMGALMQARDRLAQVRQLADPEVLLMLPRDVRERLESKLFGPLTILEAAATRRSTRVWNQLEARDRPTLEKRLAEPVEFRRLDMNVLARTDLRPSSMERFVPGDLVCVPRSDGSFTRGLVVGNRGDRLDVQMLLGDAFAIKSLQAEDVARANPLKIGDTFRAGEDLRQTVYVNGSDAHGLIGMLDKGDGSPRVALRAEQMQQLFSSTFSRYQGQTLVATRLAGVPGFLASPPHVQRMLKGLLALKGDPVFDRAAEELRRTLDAPAFRALAPQAQASALLELLKKKPLLHSVLPNFGARRENLTAVSFGSPRWQDGARLFRTGATPAPRAAVYPLTMTIGSASKHFEVALPESWPDDQRQRALRDVVNTLQSLPPESLTSVQAIVMNPVKNPDDAWFAQQFNMPGFTSAMTAGGSDRQIHVYPSTTVTASLQSFVHEVGHLVSIDAFGSVDSSTPGWDVWRNAVANDVISVSRYATEKTHEDFAETYSLYMSSKGTPRHDEYRALMPSRFAILDEIARQAVA